MDNRTVFDFKVGDIVHEENRNGYIILIVRSRHHFCTYLGLPDDSKWLGEHHDDVELDCHGGLTYSDRFPGIFQDFAPKPYNKMSHWWLGWDYAHFGDRTSMYEDIVKQLTEEAEKESGITPEKQAIIDHFSNRPTFFEEHNWTVEQLINEARTVVDSIGEEK